MPVLMLHSPRPSHPIEARSRPRWLLRLRAWCLRKLGARTLRDTAPSPRWPGRRADGGPTADRLGRLPLPASARGLLELNLVFERARGKAARDTAKGGSLTAGH